MPLLQTESFGTGDQSWLGSTHGIYDCRTVPLDLSLFSAAADYPDGYIKSGWPIGQVTSTKLYGPYTGDSTDEVQTLTVGGTGTVTAATTTAGGADGSADGREVLAGFLYPDKSVRGADAVLNAPLLDHGRIKVFNLPVPFAVSGHNTTGQFVFVGTGV
jgi:hypothetical protein